MTDGGTVTREGDVIIQQLTSLYRVWIVTKDGSRDPDPNVGPSTFLGREAAEESARNWIKETKGRILLIDLDGHLAET